MYLDFNILFMATFNLITPRLRLRQFEQRDATGFYEMNADPEVIRYTGDPPFASVQAAADFIQSYDHYAKYGYGRWTVERLADGAYLGFCGLKYHLDTGETDLGYRLIRKSWGQGYASEAALACLDYAFRELGLAKIIGRVHQANEASCRVLGKIGMKKVKQIDFAGQPGYLYEQYRRNYLSE
jgi:RimJ/RimL family protein N-acetyltransferase